MPGDNWTEEAGDFLMWDIILWKSEVGDMEYKLRIHDEINKGHRSINWKWFSHAIFYTGTKHFPLGMIDRWNWMAIFMASQDGSNEKFEDKKTGVLSSTFW